MLPVINGISMAYHRCRNRCPIRPKPARQVRPAPACPPRVAYRLDRQLFVLKIARAIHAAILLHQLFQIELRCDLGHIALTVLIRSEEHTSELQSLMRISYAVFCLKKKKVTDTTHTKETIIHNHNFLPNNSD